MKKIFFITVILLTTFCSCHFLDDYSQDLVVVKSVTDLDELLLGSVYMGSKPEVSQICNGDPGWWLLVLDDDINTVVSEGMLGATHDGAGYELLKNQYFGYTTWQMEVGRAYSGGNVNPDELLWTDFYGRINVCNIILDEIEKLPVTFDSERLAGLRVRGETHFLRAYFYFILNNVYADMYDPEKASTTLGVPMKLTAYVEHDKEKDSQFERTPLNEVYAQIVADLQASIDYFDQSPQTHSYYRTSGKAARLLLSRVYLYMQEWDKARAVANELLNMRLSIRNYPTVNKADNVIVRENPEILFSQGSLNVQNALDGLKGDFCISEDLYNLYDENDSRKELFFTRVSTDSLALSNKYRHAKHQSYVSDLYMLRASEAYLNMAEACAMAGDLTEAHKWLNDFRRYRINNYQNQNYDAETLVEEIRNERRKEFCVEGGQRWFDLRRYAVNKKYPYSKAFNRVFAVYNGNTILQHTEIFRLEENDAAYTFSIPKSVLKFDTGMPDNTPRPERDPIEIINPSTN